MSKPSTVTLPVVLVMWDLLVARRRDIRMWVEKIPLLLGVVLSSWLTILCQKSAHALSSSDHIPIALRVANSVEGYATYLRKLAFPFDLVVPVPYRFSVNDGMVGLSLLLLMVVTAWVWRRHDMLALFGWCLFLGMLVPMIGLVQAGGQWIADRYLYLPAIGIYLLVLSGLPLHRRGVQAGLALVVTGYAVLGIRQTSHWRNSETLFQHAIRIEPHAFLAHNNLSLVYRQQGDPDRAFFHVRQSLRIQPDFTEALNNLAILLIDRGKPAQALPLLERAVALGPHDARTVHNLGRYWLDRDPARALPLLEQSTRLDPTFAEGFYNLGYARLMLGQYARAVTDFQTTLSLDPGHEGAAQNLAFARTAAQSPTVPVVLQGLQSTDPMEIYTSANTLRELGEEEAGMLYERVLKIKPDFPEAWNNYGVWLASKGRLADATHCFREAVRLAPDYADALGNLREAERLAR